MIRRLLHRRDFDRLLAVPPCLRSAHFAVHHVAAVPALSRRALRHAAARKLSTDSSTDPDNPVDKLPNAVWLGPMIPKRHAPRAVTRNLLRRQVRAAAQRHEALLSAGLWLVRLRRPFAPAESPSAASPALRRMVAAELDRLFERAGP
jgi:ribonuclease P protein component